MSFGKHMTELFEEENCDNNLDNTNESKENYDIDNKDKLYLEEYKKYCEEFNRLNHKKSFEEFKRDYNKKEED